MIYTLMFSHKIYIPYSVAIILWHYLLIKMQLMEEESRNNLFELSDYLVLWMHQKLLRIQKDPRRKLKMATVKKILYHYPIHHTITRRFDIVTSILSFLILTFFYETIFSRFSTVLASHMSDEDNGKQLNVFAIEVATAKMKCRIRYYNKHWNNYQ
jgi:hypothetical protein